MKIRHKGLRALHERDDRSRLPANLVPRLRRILFRLQERLAQRGPLALVVPVEILEPALDQVPPAPDRPGQLPQRAVGPPDPEPAEQCAALAVEPLSHGLLPLV